MTNQVLGANDYCECGGVINTPSGTGCTRDCGREYYTRRPVNYDTHTAYGEEYVTLDEAIASVDKSTQSQKNLANFIKTIKNSPKYAKVRGEAIAYAEKLLAEMSKE